MKILVIDDRPKGRQRLGRALRRELSATQVVEVGRAGQLDEALAQSQFHVIFIHERLGWAEGPWALKRALEGRLPDIPVMVVGSARRQRVALKGSEPGPGGLEAAVRSALGRAQQHRALGEAEARYHGLFDSVPVTLFRTTPAGEILDVNPAGVRMLGYPDRESLQAVRAGDLYVDPEDRRQWQVRMEHEGVVHDFESRMRRHDGEALWVRVSGRVTQDQEGRVLYYEGMLEDITERKQAEEETHLLHSLLLAVGEAEDFDSALGVTLEKVCDATGWALGEAWVPYADGSRLGRNPTWFGREENLEAFADASRELTFPPGGGLPGRAWWSKGPVWMPDVTSSPDFLRASLAREIGLRAGMAVPVLAGEEVLAVLTFFSFQARREDERLLRLVTTAAAQLGAVLRRKRAEAHLEAVLKDWQETFEAIGDGVLILDPEGRVLRSNGKLEAMLGLQTAEVTGRCCYEIIHGRSDFADACPLVRTKRSGAREETEMEDPERGLWLRVTTDPIRNGSGEIARIVHIVSDITERKRAEKAMEQQLWRIGLLNRIVRAIAERQDLDSIFRVALGHLEDHFPIDFGGIGLFDPHAGTVTVVARGTKSRLLADELGLPEGAAMTLEELGLEACLRGQTAYVPDAVLEEAPVRQRVGRAGIRSIVATPLMAGEGELLGILSAARRRVDGFSGEEQEFLQALGEQIALAARHARLVEDLQKAYDDLLLGQEAVMQQERLRALGQMASGIVHDINNALSPVTGYSKLLLMTEPGLSERARQYLEIIGMAGKDIAHLATRLRAFYRAREVREERQNVQLNRLAEQVIELTRPRWRDIPQERGIAVEMRLEPSPDLPAISGNESEVREVLTNLLFNAVDALPEGGTITIRTRAAKEGQVVLEVVDTGVGMSEETRRRCLEPFYSTKGELGTGLGLAMAYGVMERHEGEIHLGSAPGCGTTVRLVFPVRPFEALPGEPLRAQVPLIAPSRRILCIDDEPLLRTLIKEMLVNDGHVVETADGGRAGLEAFRAARERGEPFDLVITDLGMPYMDGREVARAVKAASPATAVILLTGWGKRRGAEGDIPPQVDAVLSKPPGLAEMRAALAQVSRRPQA